MTERHQYDVFLSHNRADKLAVEIIARRLRDDLHLEPFLDTWHLVPGEPWQEAVEGALDASHTCAVFLGPTGLGTWDNEAMRAALDIRAHSPDFRVIPVLLPGATLPERGRLPRFLARLTWVDFRTGLDDANAFHALFSGIQGMAPGPTDQPETDIVCPFRGLEIFDEEHAMFFFGREALTQHLVEQLRTDRFLAVVGPSGSGKSSIVRAGLLSQIRQGGLPESATWSQIVFKPGSHPLEMLVSRIPTVPEAESDLDNIRQTLIDVVCHDKRGLYITIQRTLAKAIPSQRIVIVVDQFEEVFTLCHDEREREQFIANLLYAASIPGGQTIVVITMRADFFHRCTAYASLAARLKDVELIGPMDAQDLRRAMLGPAEKVGLRYEKGLIERLLADLGDAPGGLPLLQHTLLELWERRRSGWMTIDAYQAIGGVQGALAQRAETVYARLTSPQQAVARRVLLRLTEPGEGTEDTRRSASLTELLSVGDSPTDSQTAVSTLVDARLLTTSQDDRATVVVDVAHEALIRGWPRLRTWIEEDRTALRVHRQLTEAAAAWEQAGHDTGYLYRGARLLEIQVWMETHSGDLNALEQRFVNASVAEREAEQRAAQRRVRQTIGGLVGALLVVSLVAALAVWFWRAADAATRQMTVESERAAHNAATAQAERGRALSSQATAEAESQRASVAERQARARLLVEQGRRVFAAEGKLLLGLRLAVEGLALVAEDETQTQAALRDVVLEMAHSGRVVQLGSDVRAIYAVPNDHNLLLVDHKQGAAELRRADDGQLLTSLSDQLTLTSIDPVSAIPPMSGTLFLVNYATAPAEIRRTTDGSLVMSLADRVRYLQYSPNESVLAVHYENAPSELRRSSDGGLIAQLPNLTKYYAISFSPDSTVAVVRNKDIPRELRRMSDGGLVAKLPISKLPEEDYDFNFGVSFSPDSAAMILTYLNGPGEFRRTNDGKLLMTLSGHISDSHDLRFSKDSSTVLIKYRDATGEIRRISDGMLIEKLPGKLGYIRSNPFESDLGVEIIDYENAPSELRRTKDWGLITIVNDQIKRMTLSPNSKVALIQYQVAPAELRRVDDGRLIATLSHQEADADFSPDSMIVAIKYTDALGELRRVDDGKSIVSLAGKIKTTFFSPDSAIIYLGYDQAPGELLSTHDGRLIKRLPDEVINFVSQSFGPDSMTIGIDYEHVPSELRRARDGELITAFSDLSKFGVITKPSGDPVMVLLTNSDAKSELRRLPDGILVAQLPDIVQTIYYGSDTGAGSFLVIYKDTPAEVRSRDQGSLLATLADDIRVLPREAPYYPSLFEDKGVFDFYFPEDRSIFRVGYPNERKELWSWDKGVYGLVDLGLGLSETVFLAHSQRLLAAYTDGKAYLLDINLLRALGKDHATLSPSTLIRLICEGPLTTEHLNEAELEPYLHNNEYHACAR